MAFSSNTFNVTLDIKRRTPERPLLVEGDTAVTLVCQLTDNGVAMDITGLYVRCVFRRSDGRTILLSESDSPSALTVTKATGKVSIALPPTCYRDGDNFMEIQILTGDPDSGDVMATTAALLIRARNCLLTNEAVEESVEFPILQWLINALRNMGVSITMVSTTTAASASLSIVDGAYQLALSIPKGAKVTGASLSGTTLTFSLNDGTSFDVALTGIATQTWVNSQSFLKAPVTNAQLAEMQPLTIKGNDTLSTDAPQDLSISEILAMFAMAGATAQSNGSAGFVPAPTANDRTKFLRGDGTYKTPAGSTTEDIVVALDPDTESLTSLSNGDYVDKAMSLINLLVAAIADKLDTDGDGNAVTVQRIASYNFADIPTTAITLQQLVAYLGGWYGEINAKQAALTAGDGIDITNNVISATGGGGGGSDKVYEATYGSASLGSIYSAYGAGKTIFCDVPNLGRAYLVHCTTTAAIFCGFDTEDNTAFYAIAATETPVTTDASARTTWTNANFTPYVKPSGGIPATDIASGVIPSVPSAYTSTPEMDGTASAGSSTAWAKGDHVHPSDTTKADKPTEVTVSTAGAVSQACADNTIYTFTGALTSLTLTEASGAHEYIVIFSTGSTAPTVTFPSGVVFPDTFTPEANKRYEVSVRNGYAVYASWAVS